jgi:NADPH:quinone reductase-like Zn-dependent oxidoreductase
MQNIHIISLLLVAVLLGYLQQFARAFRPLTTTMTRVSRSATTLMALPAEEKKNKRVVIVGATGYIGKFVVKECIRRGYETVAVVRDSSAPKDDFFKNCEVVYGDVTDEANVRKVAFNAKTDVVISCLASRSGTKSDSYKIDYQVTRPSVVMPEGDRSVGAVRMFGSGVRGS